MKKENPSMKRFVAVAVFSIITGLPVYAAEQTLSGEITDTMCGANHASMGEMPQPR